MHASRFTAMAGCETSATGCSRRKALNSGRTDTPRRSAQKLSSPCCPTEAETSGCSSCPPATSPDEPNGAPVADFGLPYEVSGVSLGASTNKACEPSEPATPEDKASSFHLYPVSGMSESSISSTIFWLLTARSEWLDTSMPAATLRQQLGAKVRSPLMSTTQARQLPSAR